MVGPRAHRRGNGHFRLGCASGGMAVGAGMVTFGVEAARSETGLKFGYPAVLYFIWGSVALPSAAGDVRMLVRGGVFGAQRIVRHLWRMCFALFIAPASIPGFVPAFLPLLLLIFW